MIPGPPPKPTRLKVIEGNPGKRAINHHEPRPAPVIPAPPASLVGFALEEWNTVAAELHRLELLTQIDRAALAAYCQSFAIWRTAVEAINEMAARDELTHGLMIRTKSGNTIQNPLVGAINKAAASMVRYAAEFGMTPSARSRIAVFDKLGDNPVAQLLSLPDRRGA